MPTMDPDLQGTMRIRCPDAPAQAEFPRHLVGEALDTNDPGNHSALCHAAPSGACQVQTELRED